MEIVIVGSIGYDDISTPEAEGSDLLGGAATYAGFSAAFHKFEDISNNPNIVFISVFGYSILPVSKFLIKVELSLFILNSDIILIK